MKNKIALLALALSIATAAVPAFADNPSDAPLVADTVAPEKAYPQTAQPCERKTNTKERKLKAQQTAAQQSAAQASAPQSSGGMH